MKKKFLILLLVLICGITFVGCTNGGQGSNDDNQQQNDDKKVDEIKFEEQENDSVKIKSTAKKAYEDKYTEAKQDMTPEQLALFEIKYKEIMIKIEVSSASAEELKNELNEYYKQLNETIELVKKTVESFEEQKQLALDQLKMVYDSVAAVANEYNIEYVKSIYNEYVAKINALKEESKAQLVVLVNEFKAEAKKYVEVVIDAALAKTIEIARAELKKAYEQGSAVITDATLKAQVKVLYEKTDLQIAGIVDNAKSAEMIKQYMKDFADGLVELIKTDANTAIAALKAMAIVEIDKYASEAKAKLTDESIKAMINDFVTNAKTELAAIVTVEAAQEFYNNIPTLITNYVKTDLLVAAIQNYKDQIQEIVSAQVENIPYQDVKNSINSIVATELAKLDNIKDLNEIKNNADQAKTTIVESIKTLVETKAKELLDAAKSAAKARLLTAKDAALAKITDADIKAELNTAFTNAINEIDKVESKDSFETAIQNIEANFATAVTNILTTALTKGLAAAKSEAKTRLTALKDSALAKVSDADIKTELNTACANAINEIDKVTDKDSFETAISNIETGFATSVNTILTKALEKVVAATKTKLTDAKDVALAKIPDADIKAELNTAFTDAINEIDKVTSKESFETSIKNIENSFTKAVTNILAKAAAKALAAAKTEAKTRLTTIKDAALAKVTDNDIKAELNTACTNAINQIDNITDESTASAAMTQIENDFKAAVENILKKVIKKYVDLAKAEAIELSALVVNRLTDKAKAEFQEIISKYNANLDKINDAESAQQECNAAIAKLKEDVKDYVATALAAAKQEAIDTLTSSYNEVLAQVDIQSYKDQLLTLFNAAKTNINNINELKNIASGVKTILENFAKDSATVLANYFVELAAQSKADVLDRGKTLNEGYKSMTEYINLGAAKKVAANVAIAAAYKAFTAAVENVEPVAGANLLYEEAYTAFENAVYATLGIEK